MLTLSVRTEWILLGRILCRFAEFIICSVVSVVLLSIVMMFSSTYYTGFELNEFMQFAAHLPRILAHRKLRKTVIGAIISP